MNQRMNRDDRQYWLPDFLLSLGIRKKGPRDDVHGSCLPEISSTTLVDHFDFSLRTLSESNIPVSGSSSNDTLLLIVRPILSATSMFRMLYMTTALMADVGSAPISS